MSDKGTNLADALIELNRLGYKYEFNAEDKLLLMERCFCLGEACVFLQEMGLWGEFQKRYTKAIKEFENRIEEVIDKF